VDSTHTFSALPDLGLWRDFFSMDLEGRAGGLNFETKEVMLQNEENGCAWVAD
jgi:hypothetical protein